MRFLCDEMLADLARWLRAAGHDTVLAAAGTADDALLAIGRAEGRVLLSRDRQLVRDADSAGIRTVLLTGPNLDDHARVLAHGLRLDWVLAPFTRCMVDNTPLLPAHEDDRTRIPAESRALPGPFRSCPECGRVFWPGSHVRRMTERLQRWRRDFGVADRSGSIP